MAKRYIRLNWQNAPSVATPINATNLNKMDKGINDIDTALNNLENSIVGQIVDDPTKINNAAVIYSLSNQVNTLTNNLGNIKVLINRQYLPGGDTLTFNTTSGISIYLILTHQGAVLTNVRSANLVFCAYEGYSGTVAPILAGTDILITVSGMTITVKNNAAGGTTVTLIQLN